MPQIILFSGSANPHLAGAVARELAIPLGRATVERFPDGEVSVHLNESVRNREVFILQPTAPPVDPNLMELVAFADAARRAAAGRIVAIVPYFGYARSDKRGERRDPIMASAVAAMLQGAGVDHVVTIDPHSPQLEGYFRIPIDTLSAVTTLALSLRHRVPQNAVIVAPDVGALRLATRYADIIDRPVVVMHKRRATARATLVTHIVGDVEHRPALIVDDMISTGETIRRCVDALLGAGAQPEMIVAATHGLFLEGAPHKLDVVSVREVVVTDTIVQTFWPKLKTVSVAALIAGAINRAIGPTVDESVPFEAVGTTD